MLTLTEIEKIIEGMSLDELCGQVINYNLNAPPFPIGELDKVCAETHPGSIYLNHGSAARLGGKTEEEYNRAFCDIVNRNVKVPVIVTSDGGTTTLKGSIDQMAWGAIDSPELIREFGVEMSKNLRSTHVHVLLGPVVDINFNMNNPITATRSMSDSPEHVIKTAGAYVEGLVEDDRLIACCKHFPGDGCDDRNQHFCTTVNDRGRQEWLDTYGKVYKEMFKRGAKSVMCAHISLPSWQPDDECDPVLGYLPGSLSKSIMTDLLKGELGFDGCIISDAMDMVGAVAVCPREELGIRYIKAGGDLMLFAHPEDFRYIRDAVKSGEIPMERIKDAVRRVLILKNSVGLLDRADNASFEITERVNEIVEEASKRVFKVVRNHNSVLPLKLEAGDRILMITMLPERRDSRNKGVFAPMREELEKRGFRVDEKFTPFVHTELENVCEEYDCVLINAPHNPYYSNAGNMRLGSEHMGPFWDGLGLKHPKLVYASFGNPYQLYELPFLKTYINAFSSNPSVQKNYVSLLLGELEPMGKNPVELKGFFEREV